VCFNPPVSGVLYQAWSDLKRLRLRPWACSLVRLGLLPAGFYLVCFSVLTYPLITEFSTHFFTDQGDGLQNVWNLWWVKKSVTELGRLPWHTDYLHHPFGVSLLSHTLNPFNGFIGIGLQWFLPLNQTHNVIVVFSFVMSGVTAFLLARRAVGSYWPSIVAGFIFTFSSYHFAHAKGHMQLISTEWIPLFLLFWLALVTRPSRGTAVAAGVSLFLVILCDYYYFFYCVLAGAVILLWSAWRRKSWRTLIEGRRLRAFGVFAIVVMATSGPLAISLLSLHLNDPLQAAHETQDFSADLLSPIVPGGNWRFSSLTRWYWSRLPGNIYEKSVNLGISVLALVVWRVLVRRRAPAELGVWVLLLCFFQIMALGPTLQVAGKEISWFRLPYALLELVFPPLDMSGCPVRMTVMATLAAAMISAAGLDLLLSGGRSRKVMAALFFVMLVVEHLPHPLPSKLVPIPDHVHFLAGLPEDTVIVDLAEAPTRSLYFQTEHELRMALGYVSRVPRSLQDRERDLQAAAEGGDLHRLLADYGIDYLLKIEGRRVVVVSTASGGTVFPPPENGATISGRRGSH
jgi:hypothetical protein